MYDVFLSYRRDGGFETARLIYEHFRTLGLSVFFDLEELKSGKFNVKIYNAIDESENFLLILPPHSLDRCVAEDDWVRLETEYAISKGKNIVPLMLNGFEFPASLPPSLENLRVYNGVHLSREYFDASITRILTMLNGVAPENGAAKKIFKEGREENYYFNLYSEKEARRLKVQQKLIKDFDSDCYAEIEKKFGELRVLDVGSNDGGLIMDRLGKSEKLKVMTGLELNAETVKSANAKYGGKGVKFYEINIEDDSFCDNLEKIAQEEGVESYNVINLSMILLHVKAPYKILKTLRKFLSPDGVIVIKDIDDGFNVAYPDENGDFARVVEICARNETSGYRKSGRQIYTLLRRAGYGNVKLEKLGLSTVGMDFEKREAFFETYFSFVLEDCKIMAERYPTDKRIQNDYNWLKKTYDDLEEKFQEENLFFVLGFILYTASKK